jgi:hypothetical protein
MRNLDDATMIKIMANENLEDWRLNTSVILETVRVTRNFLDAELAKYESWEKCTDKNIRALFTGNKKSPDMIFRGLLIILTRVLPERLLPDLLVYHLCSSWNNSGKIISMHNCQNVQSWPPSASQ